MKFQEAKTRKTHGGARGREQGKTPTQAPKLTYKAPPGRLRWRFSSSPSSSPPPLFSPAPLSPVSSEDVRQKPGRESTGRLRRGRGLLPGVHSPRAFRQLTAVHTLTLSYRKRGGPHYEEQRPHVRRGVGDHKQGESVWQTHRRGLKQPLDGLQKGFTHGDKGEHRDSTRGVCFRKPPRK